MRLASSRLVSLARSRGARRAFTVSTAVASLALAALVLRSVLRGDVRVPHLDPRWAVVAGVLVLVGQVCKVAGWNRIFARDERPGTLTLAVAGSAAGLSSLALPGRAEDGVRLA